MVVAFLCPTSFLLCCLFLSTDLLWTVKIHIVHSVICIHTEQGRLPQHEQGTQAAWSSRVVLCKPFVQVVNYWWMIMLLLFSEQERKWFSICQCGSTFLRQKLNDLIFVNGPFKTYASWMCVWTTVWWVTWCGWFSLNCRVCAQVYNVHAWKEWHVQFAYCKSMVCFSVWFGLKTM